MQNDIEDCILCYDDYFLEYPTAIILINTVGFIYE